MNVIRFSGRLGNQMFQYAFYLSMKQKGIDVCINDISYYQDPGYFFKKLFVKSQLEKAFDVHIKRIPFLKVLFARARNSSICKDMVTFYDSYQYSDNIYHLENVYFDGYWQSEKYFQDPAIQA